MHVKGKEEVCRNQCDRARRLPLRRRRSLSLAAPRAISEGVEAMVAGSPAWEEGFRRGEKWGVGTGEGTNGEGRRGCVYGGIGESVSGRGMVCQTHWPVDDTWVGPACQRPKVTGLRGEMRRRGGARLRRPRGTRGGGGHACPLTIAPWSSRGLR
jgi:hypothetical protein